MLTLAKIEVIQVPPWLLVGALVVIVLVIGMIGVVVFALTRKPRN